MPLNRYFQDTVAKRVKSDSKFKKALFEEAINELISGDFDTAKLLLRDYINASISFKELAKELDKSDKSLQRMFGPNGNPTSENLFSVIHALQRIDGYSITTKVQ